MSDSAATPSASGTSTMKLLVDKASQRVLFAEAGKDMVDFIFGILAMPVGAVAALLRAGDGDAAAAVLGCVANVYASVEKMDAAYMQGAEAWDALLVNDSLPSGPSIRLLPTTTTTTSAAGEAAGTSTQALANPYTWPPAVMMPPVGPPAPPYYHPAYYYSKPTPASPPAESGVALRPPPDAGLSLLPPSLYRCHACHALGSPQGSRGFVQGVASYTVMDDLTVAPASNVSTVALLARLGVKDLDALEERTVTIGREECLEILKASLWSKTVLTDVFMAKTKKRARAAGDKDDDAAAASE